MRGALCFLLFASGCYQEVKLDEKILRLPEGRGTGPFEVAIPRRSDHQMHDLEVSVTLRARCRPRFEVQFPDGERVALAPRFHFQSDDEWQSLLQRRANAGEQSNVPPPAAPQTPIADPYGGPPVPGHFERQATESWPGQLRFLELQDRFCNGESDTYRISHTVAYEEREGVTLFAKVPQELHDAELRVVTVEIVPPAGGDGNGNENGSGYENGNGNGNGNAATKTERPRPKEPAPKRERPGAPKTPGAVWQAGSWGWQPGDGKWVWIAGWWLAPSVRPEAKLENPGDPAIRGALWSAGEWVWQGREGTWSWSPGRWTTPPAPVENHGDPEIPGTPWESGNWVAIDGALSWKPGHWGVPPKPALLAESPPPPPFPGAKFVHGDWLLRDGRWLWIPGFYERGDRPPPAPQVENRPPRPAPGAVWLAGYWRWENDYQWMGGHWELPPGEGYVWVADPQPSRGAVSGHWELRLRVAPPPLPAGLAPPVVP